MMVNSLDDYKMSILTNTSCGKVMVAAVSCMKIISKDAMNAFMASESIYIQFVSAIAVLARSIAELRFWSCKTRTKLAVGSDAPQRFESA